MQPKTPQYSPSPFICCTTTECCLKFTCALITVEVTPTAAYSMVDVCIVNHRLLFYCSCVECSPKVKIYFICLLEFFCKLNLHELILMPCQEKLPLCNLSG